MLQKNSTDYFSNRSVNMLYMTTLVLTG